MCTADEVLHGKRPVPANATLWISLLLYLIAVCNKDGDATFLGRNQKFENLLLCAL